MYTHGQSRLLNLVLSTAVHTAVQLCTELYLYNTNKNRERITIEINQQSIRLFGDFSSIPFSYDWVIWSQDMMLSLVDLVLVKGYMVLLKNC